MHAMRWRTSIKKLYNRFLFRLNVIVCPNNFSAVSNHRLLYSNSHPFVNQQVVASRVDCQVLSQLYECNTEYGQTTVQTMLDQMNFLHNSYPGLVDEHHPKSAAESTVDSTNTHSVVKVDYVDCTVSVRTKNCGVWKIPDFERGRGGVGKENSLGRFQSVLDDLWR
eukprot:scaffold158441_cov33-Cyclotella_meneghiniana.AAC.1